MPRITNFEMERILKDESYYFEVEKKMNNIGVTK